MRLDVKLAIIKSGRPPPPKHRPVRRFAAPEGRRRVLTAEEEARLLATRMPERLRPLPTVALHTGMRRNEPLELRWADVDWEHNRRTARAEVAKTGHARQIPMNADVRQALAGVPRDHPEGRVFGYRNLSSICRVFRRAGRIFAPCKSCSATAISA